MADTMKEPGFELVRHSVKTEQLAVLSAAEETDPRH